MPGKYKEWVPTTDKMPEIKLVGFEFSRGVEKEYSHDELISIKPVPGSEVVTLKLQIQVDEVTVQGTVSLPMDQGGSKVWQAIGKLYKLAGVLMDDKVTQP